MKEEDFKPTYKNFDENAIEEFKDLKYKLIILFNFNFFFLFSCIE